MCEKKATDKGVKIELDCPADLTGEINAALLEQAVVNLLDNAVKYSNPNAVIEVQAACEGPELVIRVKDQGCGIDAQHLPRLFERFYRGRQSAEPRTRRNGSRAGYRPPHRAGPSRHGIRRKHRRRRQHVLPATAHLGCEISGLTKS